MNAFLVTMALLAAIPARAATAEDAALERLHSQDPAARERACAELAHAPQRGPRVYPALFFAMDRDLSERVRLAAAEALITFPGDEAARRVQSFLQTEPGAQTRADLIVALSTDSSRLEDSTITDLISQTLSNDPSPEARRSAALGLANRHDSRALPAVRRAAENDADKSVRDAARRAARVLSAPRRVQAKPAYQKPTPKADAIKGQDPCPEPWAWCECDGPIKRPPKCMRRNECRVELDTMIQLGMPCTWSGLPIGASNENQ